MTLREHFTLFKRSIATCYKLEPRTLIFRVLMAVISCVRPYIIAIFSAKIIDGLYAGASVKSIARYVILTVGITFALSLLSKYMKAYYDRAESTWKRNREWLFAEKATELSYAALESKKIHRLRNKINSDHQHGYGLQMIQFVFPWVVGPLVSIITAITITSAFFAIDAVPLYVKLLFVGGIILALVADILSTNKSNDLWRVYREEIKNFYDENIKHIKYSKDYAAGKDVRLYNMADSVSGRGKALWKNLSDKAINRDKKLAFIRSIDNTLFALLKYFSYIFLIYAALHGGISIGSIAKYVSCVMLMISEIDTLFSNVINLLENNKYMVTFFQYLDIKNEMYQGTLTVEKRKDNDYVVEFRDVSFRYPGCEEYALRHVNFSFKVGEKLAVVGMNGSGKTTFIKLMCRLYDPTEGEILLNGINIKKYDYEEYLSIFSIVFQDFVMHAFTLGQNVASSAEYDRERAEACLMSAGFGARLKTMPQGTDTYLYKSFDSSGIEISGGEAQKIALARALYKDAPFIILDEPTAALDPVAEYDIYSRFNEMVGDKTAIYISHRLSSCRFCDVIAVFHEGEIVQSGTHKELLEAEDGKYHELWTAQAQYYTDSTDEKAV